MPDEKSTVTLEMNKKDFETTISAIESGVVQVNQAEEVLSTLRKLKAGEKELLAKSEPEDPTQEDA